jgi:hypothetical protein
MEGITSLALAVGLALVAIAGAVLAFAALSMLAGLVAIPVGLHAAVATPRHLVPVALAAAVVGALVIGWWIYEFVVAISGSS